VRRWISVVMVASVVGLGAAMAAPAYAKTAQPKVTVNGEVTTPTTFSLTQLEALPQTTMTVTEGARQFSDTGVLLETLALDADPAYPPPCPTAKPPCLLNTKNSLLRVTATVTGSTGGPVTFALGELDPNFGNHPALLALTEDGLPIVGGPDLVVPGDRAPARSVYGVTNVKVGVATAPATTMDLTGSITVIDGKQKVTLSAAELAALPQVTLDVSFEAGPLGTVQTHTETGPPLLDVLAAGGGAPTFNTWVAASSGEDDYVAVVTPGETLVGGRPIILSLIEDGVPLQQPRLVTDGDVKGGRYDDGVVDLYVGTGPAH